MADGRIGTTPRERHVGEVQVVMPPSRVGDMLARIDAVIELLQTPVSGGLLVDPTTLNDLIDDARALHEHFERPSNHEKQLFPDEEEWVEIGKRCSSGRRSLWMRIIRRVGADAEEAFERAEDMEAIELRAGREGGDVFIRISRDNPQFDELFDMFLVARFAATT